MDKIVVVGTGFSGSILARKIAEEKNKKERRCCCGRTGSV